VGHTVVCGRNGALGTRWPDPHESHVSSLARALVVRTIVKFQLVAGLANGDRALDEFREVDHLRRRSGVPKALSHLALATGVDDNEVVQVCCDDFGDLWSQHGTRIASAQ
jgi:hypothetical protein